MAGERESLLENKSAQKLRKKTATQKKLVKKNEQRVPSGTQFFAKGKIP